MKKENIKWILDKLHGNFFALAVLSILVVVSAFCSLLIAYVLKLFVDVATNESDYTINRVVVIMICIVLVAGIVGIICSVLSTKIQTSTERKIKQLILEKMFYSKLDQVEKYHSGEILTKLTEDIGDIASLFPNLATKLVGNMSVAILAIVALFMLNIKVALLIVTAIPALIAIVSLFNFPISKSDKGKKEAEENNRILMQEYIEKIKTVKTFKVQERFIALFNADYNKLAKEKIIFGAWEGVASFCNKMIGNAMILITLGYGSYLVIKNETTLGNLIAMVQLLNYIINPFSQVSEQISAIAKASVSVDRVKEIIELDPDSHVKIDGKGDFDKLVVENVNYAYLNKEVINGLNASFDMNKAYCIKGDNGIGKSTLLKLISGLYDPSDGDVIFEKADGEKMPCYVRPKISMLSADETLFCGTIKDNITLFASKIDMDRIKQIEANSNLKAVLESVENGYDTVIRKDGKSVSSGQAQQIALCRALYYDAKIILLDEPTNNLDRESISLFKKMVRKLKEGRIVIIVTHDDALIDACDYTYVMSNGKLEYA